MARFIILYVIAVINAIPPIVCFHLHLKYTSIHIHIIEVLLSENRIHSVLIIIIVAFAIGQTYPDVDRASTSGHERRLLQNANDGLSCGDG